MAYLIARACGEIFERIGISSVVGEIAAGVVAGPFLLRLVAPEQEGFEVLAQLGAVFLLFSVGLETDVKSMRNVGRSAALVALIGMAAPFLLGWGFMLAAGEAGEIALFVGVALVATSVGVTARVLADRNSLDTQEAQTILGAAVLDDILTLFVLGLLAGSVQGSFSVGAVLVAVLAVLGFFLVFGGFGRLGLRKLMPGVHKLKLSEPALGVAITVALLLAAIAEQIGLAALVGAFLAGILFDEAGAEHELQAKTMPLNAFFVPFFFLHVGTLVDPSAFNPSTIGVVAVLTVLGIAGKLLGGFGALRLGRRRALIVGVGMVPRGEVGIVVATIGLSAGVIGAELYGVIVAVVILTTILPPPVLSRLLRKQA